MNKMTNETKGTIRFMLTPDEMRELRKAAARQVRRPNEQAKVLVLKSLGVFAGVMESPEVRPGAQT